MNKEEFINKISSELDMSKAQAGRVLNAVINTISDELANNGKVQISGFGTFLVRERNERAGRNPQTQEEIVIPACNVPAFKAGSVLRARVNNK